MIYANSYLIYLISIDSLMFPKSTHIYKLENYFGHNGKGKINLNFIQTLLNCMFSVYSAMSEKQICRTNKLD